MVPFNLENDIIVHSEDCIEKAICKIDPEDHKLGDDIHVISTSRHETLNTITQVSNRASNFAESNLFF